MVLTERYSHPSIFRKLEAGEDALTNCHENASIPWAHGAAKLYELTGNEKWRRLVEQFWKNAVTDRGYYCTGGQGAGEYWVPPFQLGQFLTERNQEFCTVYNMVRTAMYLYKWTGETQYADYIELNLYNGFLAQQNRYTGMPTYFLPLINGSRKKWGTRTRDFWCCHGTMVQAQTLYPSLIYYEKEEDDNLIISQYIPSKVEWNCKGAAVNIEQSINMKYNGVAFFDEHDESQMSRWSLKVKVQPDKKTAFTLSFRIPYWAKETPEVHINGNTEEIEIDGGYVRITKEWLNDEVQIYFPYGLEIVALPDMPNLVSFREGPIVLAGLCESDCGIYGDFNNLKSILTPQYEHTYQAFSWKQSMYKTVGQPRNIYFKPLYEVTDEAYTVYFSKKEKQ